MFEDLLNSVKSFFTFVIIALVIIVIVVAIVKGREHYRYEERKREDEMKMKSNVVRIKNASQKWTRDHKVYFMNEIAEEYNKLQDAQNKPIGQGWACKTMIMANIDGKLEYFSLDLDSLYDLYYYLEQNT